MPGDPRLPFDPDRLRREVPAELRDNAQWVLWRVVTRDGKPTKLPVTVDGQAASSTDPATWTTFEQALDAAGRLRGAAGVGFVFSEFDPFCGIDLDDCRNPETGALAEWAAKLVIRFGSYAEVSPSGAGVKLFIRGRRPDGAHNRTKALPWPGANGSEVEVYDRARFFCVTGHPLPDCPAEVRDGQAALDQLCGELWPPKAETAAPAPTSSPRSAAQLTDEELLEKARRAKNGTRFVALFDHGDTSTYDGDESRADLALVDDLAFWCNGDAARMDCLFRRSALYRDKWDERRGVMTYGERTIAKALEHFTSGYHPDASPPARRRTAGGGEADRSFCPPGDHRCDDIGNAERFVALFGGRFRYCWDWATWLHFDGTRWALDTTGEAVAAAKETARSILREAHESADEQQRSAIAKHGITSAKRERLEAMLYLARPDLAVLSNALDADPDVLNCRNGTIDLRTGALRPHNPADLITRRAEAEYHPGAAEADTPGAVEWSDFLATTTSNDPEFTSYLRRAAGYSVTGDPNEELVFFAHGPERTGKSTFLETIRTILADYAESADFEAFLRRKDSGSDARPEIAKLQGKRFVTAVEAGPNRTFATELVKWLTGGDTISARALHRNPVSWRPCFTLWLGANDRPNVRHDDGATWRRLRVLPFVHQVPKDQADRELKRRLRETAADAVLAWLIRGCLEWRRGGLGTCKAVEKAGAAYREAMDPLGDWLADRCDTGKPGCWTPTEWLFANYQRWCSETGEENRLSRKDFGAELTALLGERKRRRVKGRLTWGYDGISLPSQQLTLDDAPDLPTTGNGVPGADPLAERNVPGVPPRSGVNRPGGSYMGEPDSTENRGNTGNSVALDDDPPPTSEGDW